MKTCNLCNQTKANTEFGPKQAKCKDCIKPIKKVFDQARRTRQMAMIQLLKSQPCIDCKIVYPYYVMDFDHLDAFEKHSDVSRLSGRVSDIKLLQEIAKCELVCANCHRIRTHNRLTALKSV